MKWETSGTQPQTKDTRESIGGDVTVTSYKEGRNFAIVITSINLIFLGVLLLAIQYGVDFSVPDMVLYNHTGGEITIYLGNEATVVQNNSSGSVPQPVTLAAWKAYKPFSIRTVNRKWSYFVVYPPRDYKKPWNSSKSEYRYQIEADGLIYLLTPDSEFPVHKLPSQPSGFPLVPQFS